MKYVAIDFETANEKRNSACSLGLALYENNNLIEERYWLIRPVEMIFKPMNIWIHGITPDMVENEKNFKEIWQEVLPYLQGNIVIAHNASFDISVLRNTLDSYEIEYPEFKYFCTVNISKNYYTEVENHKLNTLSDYLGIELKHHNAAADAKACGEILNRVCIREHIKDYSDLCNKLGVSYGSVYNGGYKASSIIGNGKVYGKGNGSGIAIKRVNKAFSSYFEGKVVVFTGPLSSMSRAQAADKIRKAGGEFSGTVTKSTNYLVVGGKHRDTLNCESKSIKHRRAEELRNKGQNIEILNEEEFFSKLYRLQ